MTSQGENRVVRTVPLGKTGLTVSPIGLGLAALGRPAYINLERDRDLGDARSVESMSRRSHDVLDAALAAGIHYFDTARSYGYAERFLSEWLEARTVEAGTVTVGSKWGYEYVGDWRMDAGTHEVKDHSVAMLERQYGESRRLLGRHLALYQIHSATLETGVLDDPGVLARLAAIRGEGRAVGLSLSGPGQSATLERALSVTAGGVNLFSTVQATFNLLEPSAADMLEAAHQAGWGVIVKEALANGRLTDHEGPPGPVLAEVADRHDSTVDAVALAWVLGHEFVDVVLSGAVTTSQLHSNVAAAELDLSAPDRAALQTLREDASEYWGTRGALRWA